MVGHTAGSTGIVNNDDVTQNQTATATSTTFTGDLITDNIKPSVDGLYDIGEDAVRYYNYF